MNVDLTYRHTYLITAVCFIIQMASEIQLFPTALVHLDSPQEGAESEVYGDVNASGGN